MPVLPAAHPGDDGIVRRMSAAEIEAAAVDQMRAEAPGLTEAEAREALARLEPLWDERFPAEQARIVRALVERVEVGPAGADIRLRVEGLAGLVRDLGAISPEALKAAA